MFKLKSGLPAESAVHLTPTNDCKVSTQGLFSDVSLSTEDIRCAFGAIRSAIAANIKCVFNKKQAEFAALWWASKIRNLKGQLEGYKNEITSAQRDLFTKKLTELIWDHCSDPFNSIPGQSPISVSYGSRVLQDAMKYAGITIKDPKGMLELNSAYGLLVVAIVQDGSVTFRYGNQEGYVFYSECCAIRNLVEREKISASEAMQLIENISEAQLKFLNSRFILQLILHSDNCLDIKKAISLSAKYADKTEILQECGMVECYVRKKELSLEAILNLDAQHIKSIDSILARYCAIDIFQASDVLSLSKEQCAILNSRHVSELIICSTSHFSKKNTDVSRLIHEGPEYILSFTLVELPEDHKKHFSNAIWAEHVEDHKKGFDNAINELLKLQDQLKKAGNQVSVEASPVASFNGMKRN